MDPKAVPDVERVGEYVDESFLELRDAAGVAVSDLPPLSGRTNGMPAERSAKVEERAD